MAPRCKLVSLRVLDENGKGSVSNLIAAINHVQEINGYGRHIVIHGVNMSLGYNFEPEWFACGQSPLCAEVDRLVKSGVVVVVAAGNTGLRHAQVVERVRSSAGMALTINDPGNADLAITVGSTHRDMPHVYGVSYFSSKGPTGDGRIKPDLVAPGEKIISCAAGISRAMSRRASRATTSRRAARAWRRRTSAARSPRFSPCASSSSARRNVLKEIFVDTTTDLRHKHFPAIPPSSSTYCSRISASIAPVPPPTSTTVPCVCASCLAQLRLACSTKQQLKPTNSAESGPNSVSWPAPPTQTHGLQALGRLRPLRSHRRTHGRVLRIQVKSTRSAATTVSNVT